MFPCHVNKNFYRRVDVYVKTGLIFWEQLITERFKPKINISKTCNKTINHTFSGHKGNYKPSSSIEFPIALSKVWLIIC